MTSGGLNIQGKKGAKMRHLVRAALLFIYLQSLCIAADSIYIYGIHSWSDGASGIMNGRGGWSVEVVNTDYFAWDFTTAQAQRLNNEGFTLILRINKYFGQTIPAYDTQFDAFAQAVADKAWTFRNYTSRFIIGNEMNASFEGNIPATNYINCFRKCRTKIKERLPQAEVIVGAVAPWNSDQPGVDPIPPIADGSTTFTRLLMTSAMSAMVMQFTLMEDAGEIPTRETMTKWDLASFTAGWKSLNKIPSRLKNPSI